MCHGCVSVGANAVGGCDDGACSGRCVAVDDAVTVAAVAIAVAAEGIPALVAITAADGAFDRLGSVRASSSFASATRFARCS